MALLEVRDLKVNYGPIQAIRGIDLDVEQGQIVALLGANGAGKTTTMKTLSGVVKATSGQILYEGQNICNKQPYLITKMEIGRASCRERVFRPV